MRKKFSNNSGFTLMEMLIVMSILALVGGAGMYKIIGAQEKTALDDAEAATIRFLEDARNRSASGVGTEKHGVYIEETSITIFEANSYTPGVGTQYFFHPAVETDQTGTEIIFERISAETSGDFTIILSGSSGGQKIITVTSEGSITST